VRKFATALTSDQSMCHQLIMGAGKTTVIAPLLALLLASPQHLFVCCMPAPLLPFAQVIVVFFLFAIFTFHQQQQ
jgi:hypothetical protein